jgi:AAA domain
MTTGEALFGQSVRQGEAVWLSEEADISLLDKATRFGIRASGHSFAGRQDPLTWHNWESMIETAATEAVARSASLLVVDSFAALARVDPEQENDAGAISQKMAALSAATSKGLAVLLLHHSNVSGRPRGSTAFEGSADIVVRLNLRCQTISLKSVSRFAPIELSGRLDGDNAPQPLAAVPDGTQDRSPRLSETDELLWQALKEAGHKGITYSELHRKPGSSRFSAMRRLEAWQATQRVDYSGTGVKGDPKRWFLTDSVR